MKADYCIHIPMRGLSPISFENGSAYLCSASGLYRLEKRDAICLLPCRPSFGVYHSIGAVHDNACNIDQPALFDGYLYLHTVAPMGFSIPADGRFEHKAVCIDQKGRVQWEFTYDGGIAFGGVRADRNGGCFAVSCQGPETADILYKLAPNGNLEWRREFSDIRFLGQRQSADSVQIIDTNTRCPGTYALLNIHGDGSVTTIAQIPPTLQQILYDIHGNLYVIMARPEVYFKKGHYDIQRYNLTSNGEFILAASWQCKGDFFAAPYAWGISPNGQYLAAVSFDISGDICESNLTRIALAGEQKSQRFTLSCSRLNHVELNEGHCVAPIVEDDGTIFSVWRSRKNNIVVKTTDSEAFEIIRKTTRTIFSLQLEEQILYISEYSGNNSWVSVVKVKK